MTARAQVLKTLLSCGSAVKSPNPLSVVGCGVNVVDGVKNTVRQHSNRRSQIKSIDCARARRDLNYRRRLQGEGVDVNGECVVSLDDDIYDPAGGTFREDWPGSDRLGEVNQNDLRLDHPEEDLVEEPQQDWLDGESDKAFNGELRSCPACGTSIDRRDASYCWNCGEELTTGIR